MNISAVLTSLGEDTIPGYRPAFNIQAALTDAVARWLVGNPAWPIRLVAQSTDVVDAPLQLGPAPTFRNQPPPDELERALAIAQRFDAAGRDARNRVLGRAGEDRVIAHERATLASAGRADLARRVRWTSEEDGDGLGYDIASFEPDGRSRLIEVKTTRGWERTPFQITRNELTVAEDRRDEWYLLRLWNFSSAPRAFELRPPLGAHVSLVATTFEAGFA
jgi:hypothetical protein